MSDIVIVAYKPKPGKDDELLQLVREHVPILRQLELATDRPVCAMKNKDGVVIKVFEWREGAIEKAHNHPEVQKMWERYAAVCDYVPLNTLPEAADLFAEFKPIDL